MKHTATALQHHLDEHFKYGSTYQERVKPFKERNKKAHGNISRGHRWCINLIVYVSEYLGETLLGKDFRLTMYGEDLKRLLSETSLLAWFHHEVNDRRMYWGAKW
jgi:hypothetical protein